MNRQDDPRLGQILIDRETFDKLTKVNSKFIGLIRVPCDEGVGRNGGRLGASDGPNVVMDLLPRFGVLDNREWNINLLTEGIQLIEYGSTEAHNLEQVHRTLKRLVNDCLKAQVFPLCIGGGNDQSWPNGAAWIEHLRSINSKEKLKLTIINVDAHLDVRPLVSLPDGRQVSHSGSPFRQLLEFASESDDCKLIEFAAQGQQCSSAHVNFVEKHGGEIIWFSDLYQCDIPGKQIKGKPKDVLRNILSTCESSGRHVFFSFDLDSIQAADCPGVSCPSPIGLTSRDAIELCLTAGRSKAVELMDISEFNPRIESSQTARLIANMIYYFLLGFSQRHR